MERGNGADGITLSANQSASGVSMWRPHEVKRGSDELPTIEECQFRRNVSR